MVFTANCHSVSRVSRLRNIQSQVEDLVKKLTTNWRVKLTRPAEYRIYFITCGANFGWSLSNLLWSLHVDDVQFHFPSVHNTSEQLRCNASWRKSAHVLLSLHFNVGRLSRFLRIWAQKKSNCDIIVQILGGFALIASGRMVSIAATQWNLNLLTNTDCTNAGEEGMGFVLVPCAVLWHVWFVGNMRKNWL